MSIRAICGHYFDCFNQLSHYSENSYKNNLISVIEAISYIIFIIPLVLGIAYYIDSLCGRVTVETRSAESPIPLDEKNQQPEILLVKSEELTKVLPPQGPIDPIQRPINVEPVAVKPIGAPALPLPMVPQITEVIKYPGDLTNQAKQSIKIIKNGLGFQFEIKDHLEFAITVRGQDLFESGAEIVVNAANTYLGGGGGIDGETHEKGGRSYAKAHRELRDLHQANYKEGYAAMISSGDLQKQYGITNVIVVAGPKGPTTSTEKENQLYSCYYNSLVLAHKENKISIAFPSISTGIYCFPSNRAAAVSLKAIFDFITDYPESRLRTISIHFLPETIKDGCSKYADACSYRK